MRPLRPADEHGLLVVADVDVVLRLVVLQEGDLAAPRGVEGGPGAGVKVDAVDADAEDDVEIDLELDMEVEEVEEVEGVASKDDAVELDEIAVEKKSVDILDLNEALEILEESDPDAAELVKNLTPWVEP